MKYILKENLQPIVHGFTNDDYESDYGLLRGHLVDVAERDLDQENCYVNICNKNLGEASF